MPGVLWLILAVALALRLWGAWCANLIFDERAHLALAETIDFRPAHMHLVSQTLDHPLLSIYVLKLGGLLLGTSDFGLRIPYVLAGTLTVVPVFFLGKRVFSERAGLWAAGLLAVDQFHASWSRVFMPEVWMLLFATLVLLQFLRVLEKGTVGNYVLLGLLLGLAYLAKEPAILLLHCLWIYLLITPRDRHLIRRWRWYLAHAVMLLVVAPDVLWNLAQGRAGYLYRDAMFASESFCVSLKSLSLYLGEAFRWLVGPDVLDPEYDQGGLYVCHWPAGMLCLVSIVSAFGKLGVPGVRLLLVVFMVIFGVFLVMPGGGLFEPYWWASMSLIPAVLCAGWVLDRLSNRGKVWHYAGLLWLAYLGVQYIPPATRPGPYDPRASVDDFAADFLRRAHEAMAKGDLREAQHRCIYVLNISGPNADAYYGLALVAQRRGNRAKAESLAKRSLELAPNHEPALKLTKEINRSSTGPRSLTPNP